MKKWSIFPDDFVNFSSLISCLILFVSLYIKDGTKHVFMGSCKPKRITKKNLAMKKYRKSINVLNLRKYN